MDRNIVIYLEDREKSCGLLKYFYKKYKFLVNEFFRKNEKKMKYF
jgi:hypothetical protein